MGLSNDEAKAFYFRAVEAMKNHGFADALALLDQLDADRPNSRHVMQQRAHCLIALGRAAEAESICAKLEGKIDAAQLAAMREKLASMRPAPAKAEEPLFATPSRPAPSAAAVHTMMASAAAPAEARNVFTVEQVYPVSITQAAVTGSMAEGTFRTGDVLTVIAPDGSTVKAPVRRIGPAETPVNLLRAGQRNVLLLDIEQHLVAPGAAIWSVTKEEAYAATMVAGSQSPPQDEPQALPPALVEIERLMRSHAFDEAKERLDGFLSVTPDNRTAHRMLARVYLDAGTHIRNPALALEHIRKAYELGGASEPAIVETLSEALAETGDAQGGLRFLERLNQAAPDQQARAALGGRVRDYRTRYGLGSIWEFADQYGDVLFETGDIAEAVKALQNGTIPKDAKCRRDRTGAWQSIESTLAPQYPEIAKLYKAGAKAADKSNPMLVPALVFVVVAAMAAAAVFYLR